MSDYTPTDGEVLTAVVLYRAIASVDAPPPTIETIATPEETARYLGEYQRWLAEHDAALIEGLADEYAARLPDGTGNGRAYNSHTVARMLREKARQRREEQA